jgi:N,N'-diacetyllegionaminate synthase
MNPSEVFIIAEAGVNHNGSLDIAYQLIDAAVQSGADAVKFQTFKADNLVSKNARKAEYQKKIIGNKETQYQMLKKLELDYSVHQSLVDYCQKAGIVFMSTPFDLESIEFLDSLRMQIFKIPSGEITNLPYLRKIGILNKKVILSTGMAELSEVGDAMNVLTESGTRKENIIILHATTEYPCPMDEVNLKAMQTLESAFGVGVGYSDHTMGIEVAIAAVALGASVIEKHFTLDRNMEGPDHKASLEPDELKSLVSAVRNIEKALGDGIKKPSKSEEENKSVARKSIIAIQSIKKGDMFSEKNIGVKRPGTGITPMRWDEIIGQIADKDYQEDDLI